MGDAGTGGPRVVAARQRPPLDSSPQTSAIAHPTRTPTFLSREAVEQRRSQREIISAHWECAVENVGDSTFTAILRSLRTPGESETVAEIPRDEVSDDDLELLSPGAIFYWTVGYQVSPAGTRKRFSQIKFRRLPAWTRKDLDRVRASAKTLYELFGGEDADNATGE